MTQVRRGRPRRSPEHVDAMRERIIATARGLFAAEGFQSVSMRKVAAQAGCSPMALYGYFRNKNELLRHIWEQFFDPLFASVAQAAAQATTPRERLRGMCQAYLAYWLEHPDRYRLVYLNDDRVEDGEVFYAHLPDTVTRHSVFAEAVGDCQAAGDIGPGDKTARGEALLCTMIGVAHNLITVSEHRWRAGPTLLDVVLDGLFASGSPRP